MKSGHYLLAHGILKFLSYIVYKVISFLILMETFLKYGVNMGINQNGYGR